MPYYSDNSKLLFELNYKDTNKIHLSEDQAIKCWEIWGFRSILKSYHSIVIGNYRKFPKYSDTQRFVLITKILTMWLYHRVMCPNDADGMVNSIDPDQTASLGAVWFGSALFAQAYLSENLGSLQYFYIQVFSFSQKNHRTMFKLSFTIVY